MTIFFIILSLICLIGACIFGVVNGWKACNRLHKKRESELIDRLVYEKVIPSLGLKDFNGIDFVFIRSMMEWAMAQGAVLAHKRRKIEDDAYNAGLDYQNKVIEDRTSQNLDVWTESAKHSHQQTNDYLRALATIQKLIKNVPDESESEMTIEIEPDVSNYLDMEV